MRQARTDVTSTKITNVLINWKQTLGATPSMALTVAGSTTSAWIMILAGLTLLVQLYQAARIRLEREHGIVAAALAASEPIHRDDFISLVENSDSHERLSRDVIGRIIDDLIVISAADELIDGLRMMERIRIEAS
jgi:hypothetical protein